MTDRRACSRRAVIENIRKKYREKTVAGDETINKNARTVCRAFLWNRMRLFLLFRDGDREFRPDIIAGAIDGERREQAVAAQVDPTMAFAVQ